MPKLIRPTLAMAIVYVSTLTLGAQTTPAPPAQSSATPEQQITVTGCLQAAEPSPTGTRGPGADASDAKFMLTKIERAPETTAPTGASSRTYRLIANPEALSPHVGKKLELTGVVDTAGGGATSPTADKNANAPALRVVSGKVIAVSCEGTPDR
jgi:hypothetical protein